MPDDTELLEQRVTKRKQKLEQAAAVVSMVQERVATATAADEQSGRELRTLSAALKAAEKKAKRLKKRTKQAQALSGSAAEDRLAAERELAEELQRYDKQQAKLAKAEAALAAGLATQRVEDVAPPEATQEPAKTTGATQGRTPARKTAPRKRTAATTTAAKKTAPRKRTATTASTTSAAKKTTSTTGRTTGSAGSAGTTGTSGTAGTAGTAKKASTRKSSATKSTATKATATTAKKTPARKTSTRQPRKAT